MFSLFFIQPDIQFILAFLCAVILCCVSLFLENDTVFTAVCLCFLAAAALTHTFLYFYPVTGYCLFRKKRSALWIVSLILLFIFAAVTYRLPVLLLCMELFGFLIAFLLAQQSSELEILKETLRRTQDDSTERDILLTEKNRTLLEKQDYEIYTATLKERNRIAREIHDNVGHLLSRSILLTGAAKAVNHDEGLSQTLDSLDKTLNSAMDNIRTSVHDLRDESVNLDEAVRSLIKDFTFCPVSYLYDAGHIVPKDVKYSFISITKEALSNIMRHSNASKASVTIREHPALYQLCIEDNGTKVKKPGNSGSGMGLSNMRERTAKLKGNIHIFTENGFKILITIPKRRQLYETDTDR